MAPDIEVELETVTQQSRLTRSAYAQEERDGLVVEQYCHYHSSIETVLNCGNCDKPICAKCLIHHPVGIRCRGCAKMPLLPIFNVTLWHYAKAGIVVVAMSATGTFVIGLLLPMIVHSSPLLFYLRLAGLGMLGYLAGEAVSFSVNRKRSMGLRVMASSVVILVYMVSGTAIYSGIYGFITVTLAVFLAIRPFRW